MTHRLVRSVAPALTALALASCGDSASEPERAEKALPTAEFAVASNSWIQRTDMPSDRFNLATAVVTNALGQSILYAIGGSTPTGGSLSKVQAYNVATNSWTTKAPLPMPLYWTNGVGVIGGKLYISGGVASYKNYRAELYRYDPATNTWTRKHDMPNTTFRGVTGVIQNRLYVLTGCDQEDCFRLEPRAFYRYDPATDQWTSLPTPTNYHGWGMSGVIGWKFYVVGGSNQLDVYDPATNTWMTKAPMTSQRWLGAGTALGGKLYVIGGYRSNPDGTITTGVPTTSVYDPKRNIWTNKAPLPTPRSGIAASAVVFDGQPRVELVGGTRPGNNLAYIP
jgi:N-acetylneuraminic acid mutarotase